MARGRCKRGVIFSDPHCLSRVGLVDELDHEDYRPTQTNCDLHDFFTDLNGEFKKPDYLIHLGDGIDGRIKGEDNLSSDRNKQTRSFMRCLEKWDAKKYILVEGTDAHVSTKLSENFEENIVSGLVMSRLQRTRSNKTVFKRFNIAINGFRIGARHFISNTTIPYGELTAVSREATWNALNSVWGGAEPQVDLIIRGHVHRYAFGENPWVRFMTVPGFKARGCNYGSKRCTGRVDVGIVHFEIDPGGHWKHIAHLKTIKEQDAELMEV